MGGVLLLFVSLVAPVQSKAYYPNRIFSWLKSVFGFLSTIMDGIIVFDITPLVGNLLSHFTTHEIND